MARTRIALLVLVLAAFPTGPAQAKEGFSLGAGLLFNDFGGDIGDLDSGNGVGLRGGFGFNRYLSFEAGVFKTDNDLKNGTGTVDFTGATIDAKVNFPLKGSHIEPYIFGGVGTYRLVYPTKRLEGKGGQAGVGMEIYLFPELSFNVGLALRSIKFDATATTPSLKGRVTVLDAGLTYHFI